MTQGINGYGNPYDRYTGYEPPAEPAPAKAARDYCTHADSVVGGYLCDEPTVIANACRAGGNEVDRTLCDDKKLAAAQDGVWNATKEILKTIVNVMIGRVGK